MEYGGLKYGSSQVADDTRAISPRRTGARRHAVVDRFRPAVAAASIRDCRLISRPKGLTPRSPNPDATAPGAPSEGHEKGNEDGKPASGAVKASGLVLAPAPNGLSRDCSNCSTPPKLCLWGPCVFCVESNDPSKPPIPLPAPIRFSNCSIVPSLLATVSAVALVDWLCSDNSVLMVSAHDQQPPLLPAGLGLVAVAPTVVPLSVGYAGMLNGLWLEVVALTVPFCWVPVPPCNEPRISSTLAAAPAK